MGSPFLTFLALGSAMKSLRSSRPNAAGIWSHPRLNVEESSSGDGGRGGENGGGCAGHGYLCLVLVRCLRFLPAGGLPTSSHSKPFLFSVGVAWDERSSPLESDGTVLSLSMTDLSVYDRYD